MSYSKIKKIKRDPYDIRWSVLIRERDGKCQYCGNTQNLAAHHFLRRGVKSTRLMLVNGISLCPSHHVFNYEFSAHRTPEAFKRWFKQKFPDRYKQIMQKSLVYMTERQAKAEFENEQQSQKGRQS